MRSVAARGVVGLLVGIVAVASPVAPVRATPGDLDTTFGVCGKVATSFSGADRAVAIARQADGKLVVFGNANRRFALARLHADGSLDASFGSAGIVNVGPALSASATFFPAESLALRPDGKIVVLGELPQADNFAPVLGRFASGGAVDTTFGSSGFAAPTLPFARFRALALQADGKIVIVGGDPFSGGGIIVARLTAEGAPDATFDGDGVVVVDPGGSGATADAVVIQSDGKIVVAGSADFGGSDERDFVLARLETSGGLDATFDADGVAHTGFTADIDETALALAIRSDGKLIAAGYDAQGFFPAIHSLAVARYDTDGSLDTTFDGDGRALTSLTASDLGTAIVVQDDGATVVAGASDETTIGDFGLVRYEASGALDATFGTSGTVLTDFAGRRDAADTALLQPDGKLVVAGYAVVPGGDKDFAIARYTTTGALDATFGSGGKVTVAFPGASRAALEVVQPDQKPILVGIAGESAALARYEADGVLDATFDVGGRTTLDFDENLLAGQRPFAVVPEAVLVQSDGKIVVGGKVCDDPGCGFNSVSWMMARYASDGTLDPTFGDGGRALPRGVEFNDVSSDRSALRRMLVQPDGKILILGHMRHTSNSSNDILHRVLVDGSREAGFTRTWPCNFDLTGGPRVCLEAMALQSDGKIVLGGEHQDLGDAALLRLNMDDTDDVTFNGGAIVTTDFGGTRDVITAITVQPDTKILVSGTTFSAGTGTQRVEARYLADGTLDGSFGTAGLRLLPPPMLASGSCTVGPVNLDDSFYCGGTASDDFLAGRFLANGMPDPGFGSAGLVGVDFAGGADAGLGLVPQLADVLLQGGSAAIQLETATQPGRTGFGLVRYVTTGEPSPCAVPTSTPTPTPTPTAGAPRAIDHFLAYKAKEAGKEDKLPKDCTVTLDDPAFDGAENDTLGKVTALYLPADKNAEGVDDPTTHLVGYKLKPAKQGIGAPAGAPGKEKFPKAAKHAKRLRVAITNQLGSLLLDTKKQELLLVPTVKDLAAPPVLDLAGSVVDHYQCYKVKPAKAPSDQAPGGRFRKGLQATVADQFLDGRLRRCAAGAPKKAGKACKDERTCGGTEGATSFCETVPHPVTGTARLYDLKKPVRLCNPVAKTAIDAVETDGKGAIRTTSCGAVTAAAIQHPDTVLVCYQAKAAKKVVDAGVAGRLGVAPGTKLEPKPSKHTKRTPFVANQLGKPGRVQTKKELELCLPSTLVDAGVPR